MLTLESILRTTRHLTSYGSSGRHQLGQEPRTPASGDNKLDDQNEDPDAPHQPE